MWLESEALSLNGGSGLIRQSFYAGQPLLRRAKQSVSAVLDFPVPEVRVNPTVHFRGHSLDVAPNYGAWAGEYRTITSASTEDS